MFKKILFAIDLTESEMTMQAIDKPWALARAFNSDLRLVNVQTLIPVAFLDTSKEISTRIFGWALRTRSRLSRLASIIRPHKFRPLRCSALSIKRFWRRRRSGVSRSSS